VYLGYDAVVSARLLKSQRVSRPSCQIGGAGRGFLIANQMEGQKTFCLPVRVCRAAPKLTCAVMRKRPRRQLLVLGALIAWAILLALGLIGQSIPVVPRAVTTAAGLIAAVGGFFFIPSSLLYGLLREPGVRDSSLSWLAIRWRWQSAISGGLVALVGVVLLHPGTSATLEIRVAAVVALVWGGLCMWISVLAFRKRVLARGPRPV